MKLRTRLLLTLVALTVLLAGPAIYALSRLTELRDIAGDQRSRHAYALMQHGELTTSVAELDRYERGYIIAGSDDQRAGMERALRDVRLRLDTLRVIGYGDAIAPAERTLAQLQQTTQQVIAFMESGREEEATVFFGENVRPLLSNAQSSIRQIAVAIDESSKEDMINAVEISRSAARTTMFGLIACLLIAAILGVWTASTFTRRGFNFSHDEVRAKWLCRLKRHAVGIDDLG